MSEPTIIPLNADLLRAWLQLPPEYELQHAISRQTVDKLFFAVNGALNAQASLLLAVQAFTRSETSDGNLKMEESRATMVQAANQLNSFLTDIVAAEVLHREG